MLFHPASVVNLKEEPEFRCCVIFGYPLLMQKSSSKQREQRISEDITHSWGVGGANLLTMRLENLKVGLKFFEDIHAVDVYYSVVQKVLELPGKDTHTGRLQWKEGSVWSGYHVKLNACAAMN